MATTPPKTYEPTKTPPDADPRPQHVAMMLSDLYLGGSILLVISVIFIVINGFLSWLVFKNWTTIKRSRFFNSFLLGLVLSLADFALAVLVGLPASFHLTWMSYFREQPPMRFYSMYIGHFLFEYIFLFRVLVIALLSTDSFLHIQFPLRYDADYESRRRVHVACGVAAAVPLLFRTLPSLVLLLKYSEGMTCMEYKDPNATTFEEIKNLDHFYLPLNCAILLSKGHHSIVKVDVIILATITAVSWFVITATNITSLLTAFRRIRNSTRIGSVGISMRQIVKATLLICSITFTFMLTNFPYVCIWWMDYLSKKGYSKGTQINDQLKFYLMILAFLSLVFHPWFFVLRLKSYRDLLKVFKKKLVRSIRSSQHLTKTSLASPTSKRIRLDTAKSIDSNKMKKTSRVYRNEAAFCQIQTTTTNIAQVTTAAELRPAGMQTDC